MLKKLLKTKKKKLLEIQKLKLPKTSVQLVESPTGAHPDGHQHGDRKPTETLAVEFCYLGVNLSLEELRN